MYFWNEAKIKHALSVLVYKYCNCIDLRLPNRYIKFNQMCIKLGIMDMWKSIDAFIFKIKVDIKGVLKNTQH